MGLRIRLRLGGNDVGSVMLEENVVRAAGVTNCTTEKNCAGLFATRDSGQLNAMRCIGSTS